MIGKLYGIIDEKYPSSVIIKTAGGVGYKVFLPARSLTQLTEGSEITLYTYTHIREQELSLFGFVSREEESVFTTLLGVSGVGPKTAVGILGFGNFEKLVEAIKNQEVHYISSIPGIGKKTAQKILLELASKFNTEFSLEKTAITEDHKMAIDALIALGFRKPEAISALEKIAPDLPVEERVKKALQQLNK